MFNSLLKKLNTGIKMKNRLLLIALLLSYNVFSQNYKEKAIYGLSQIKHTPVFGLIVPLTILV